MPKRQKRARPYVGSKSSETGCAYGPHEMNGITDLAAKISLAAGTVSDRRTQAPNARTGARRVERQKRFKALSGSRVAV